ncbi:hypothetical protein EGW08_019149 [Elysia chlorotica]|uniref:UDENN domain-containing protein n=1 Tax=Elysia chlorotica TaxID=188477 RepID=A0A433SV96_ELYCH|nr:hypothetical protein EGW08_019149 [Elysia chlorotica]
MEEPVLHVIVVGFHHKKGCQVEFSYPPLIEGNSYESHEIPEEWKHIPSLALPDGAHNYEKDTVYFVLPGRKHCVETVYGVSCYRQMDAKDLINRTADVTRSTVQKSVCVLSKLPLFGLIKAKLELITHAYFDERDFSQVALLEQTYKNLNSSLTQILLQGTQVFLGLPVRDLVILYKHKIIVLFKLLLLERRVLFFGSPVERLSQNLLSLVSLFPGRFRVLRDSASESGKESVSSETKSASVSSLDRLGQGSAGTKNSLSTEQSPSEKQRKSKAIRDKLSAAFHKSGNSNKVNAKGKKEDLQVVVPKKKQDGNIVLKQDELGYPLAIFTKGCVCQPYLSLQYHDILTDVNVRSFLIGATNVLFKQRRQVIDVVVEVGDGKLDIRDKELQRLLSLTTADLRFAEYLVQVTAERPGDMYDGTEWEGSDEWIRAQFKHYLNCLLATVLTENQKLMEDFGSSFVSAWKTTNNFRHWQNGDYPGIKEMPTGHPFQGHLSMTDVRVRFNQALQSSEQGRRINAAVVQTGKYVVQTGKVVGGAFSSAKSAVSGWFSSWRSSEKIQTDQTADSLPKTSQEEGESENGKTSHEEAQNAE